MGNDENNKSESPIEVDFRIRGAFLAGGKQTTGPVKNHWTIEVKGLAAKQSGSELNKLFKEYVELDKAVDKLVHPTHTPLLAR